MNMINLAKLPLEEVRPYLKAIILSSREEKEVPSEKVQKLSALINKLDSDYRVAARKLVSHLIGEEVPDLVRDLPFHLSLVVWEDWDPGRAVLSFIDMDEDWIGVAANGDDTNYRSSMSDWRCATEEEVEKFLEDLDEEGWKNMCEREHIYVWTT